MEIRRRVSSSLRTTALLIVSITITAAILVGVIIDTLAPVSLSAQAQLRCGETVQPVLQSLEIVEIC